MMSKDTRTRSDHQSPASSECGTPTPLQSHAGFCSETPSWGGGTFLLAALSSADCPATAETKKKIEKMSPRDPQEPTNFAECGVPSRMKRERPQDCQELWSAYLWQAGYEAFRPPFPVNSSPGFRDINSSALSEARIKWQDGKLGSTRMFSPNSCLARAMSDALHGSTGRVGCRLCWGSIPIPPHPLLACSPKNHIQTQIARLHPPPPLKSIIRRSRQPAAFYSSAGSWSGVKGSGGRWGRRWDCF